ncbi:MAG: sulfatase [Planctomycetota bacterium]|nr:sulfatase [Planctomycetota bacterium]
MNSGNLSRRVFLRRLGGLAVACGVSGLGLSCAKTEAAHGAAPAAPAAPPNFVIVMTDDQGYADVGCYGAKDFQTPNLDRMATEGVRLTDFYVGAPICTPSRAALLTGCYPQRVGLPNVLGPNSKVGLSDREMTIAQVLKARGYATACYGKWHLGDAPKFLPTRHGFDEYFGLPYSNDMWPNHPTGKFPDLPLIEGEKVVNPKVTSADQRQLTTWYAERAVGFIEKNKDRPFFLYVPHTMPHVPLHVSDKYKGKSARGLYGDVIMEIDWSVGQILAAVKRLGLDGRTMVIFTSDNGPWLAYGDHAGSAGPLREGKHTTFEGGQRVPCIMRWPGRLPAGRVVTELVTSMDVLPTIASLAGAPLPPHPIDGKDAWPVLSCQEGAKSPIEFLYYYVGWHLQGVRSGRWKLHVPHAYHHVDVPGTGGRPGKTGTQRQELALYDLAGDIGETTNVADRHPEVVQHLSAMIEKCREDLGDAKSPGKGRREPGRKDIS